MSSHIELNRSLFPKLTYKIYLNHANISPISILVEQNYTKLVADYAQKGLGAFPIYLEQRITLRQKIFVFTVPRTRIAFVTNTSTGIIQIAQNFNWEAKDRILLLQGEFPTNITPWQQVARQHNLKSEWMNTDDFRTPSLGLKKLRLCYKRITSDGR